MSVYLEFENEIKLLEDKLSELKEFSVAKDIDLSIEIEKLEMELNERLEVIYSTLNPWQRVMVARHPKRPYTLDYVEAIVTDFVELHGDRVFKDDKAIVGGIGKIDGQGVMIIGHQKGRDLASNLERNFGYANPEGYRKALRLMKTAERLKLPILTLIDTAGAYPGLEAEERGQSEAIARNLLAMAGLKVPVVAVVIGEGGSGGALAIGVANRVFMLENSVYSVISPEGCAAILFNDASMAPKCANNLNIDAASLKKLEIVEDIIKEGTGGAHRNYQKVALNLKEKVLEAFTELKKMNFEELRNDRYEKFRKMGKVNIE